MVNQNLNSNNSSIKSVWYFFGLAFFISWVIWIPTILFIPEDLRLPFFGLGVFGPFLSALIVSWRVEGRAKGWLRETFRLRINIFWYLVGAIFLPFGIAVLYYGLYLLFGGRSGFSFNQNWLLYLGFLIYGAILAGGNEEPGWRGFATPRLMLKYHPIITNCIVGIFWVTWHLPLWWITKDQPILWFFLYAIGLSIIMTWLYYKSRSIIPVMLLHAGTNVVFGYFPMVTVIFRSMDYDFIVIKTIAYWIVAIIIIILTKGKLGYLGENKTKGD